MVTNREKEIIYFALSRVLDGDIKEEEFKEVDALRCKYE